MFVFKQKTAYVMRISDWSSDVCSSDLPLPATLDIDPQPARLMDRLDHLPARADGVRLLAGRDLLGIRVSLDRGRRVPHVHGWRHHPALTGIAALTDPHGNLSHFQLVSNLSVPARKPAGSGTGG